MEKGNQRNRETKMNVIVNEKLKTPLYRQIATQIKDAIIKGEILDGFPVLSERDMARMTGVHRNTVRRAYNDLEGEGLIQARHGVGYVVTYATSEKPKEQTGGKRRIKKVNWSNMIKDEYLDQERMFDDLFSKSYEEGKISFAGGTSSSEIYDEKNIAEALAKTLSKGNSSYFYTPYQGDYSLRQNLSGFMRGKGVLAAPSEIQILSETNQALDFIVTLLLSTGDKVITEEAVSPDVYRAIELAGGIIICVPMDEEGMITDNLAPLIEKHNPKFIYVNSTYHDPTSVQLSLKRRRQLVSLSSQYRIPIIEDDASSELAFEGDRLPPIKAFDEGNNVIYIYSFGLTFVPGISIAFVAATKEIIKGLSYLVSVRLVNLDWISQKLLDNYLEDGTYERKLIDFREEYKQKRDTMCAWIENSGLEIAFQKPTGGVYLWCKLPDEVDIQKLSKAANRQGVSFIPGSVFYPQKNQQGNYIRLNYSHATIGEINKGMSILIELIKGLSKI